MSTDVRGVGISLVNVGRKLFQAEEQSDTKAFRWEYACDIQGPARGPPRLVSSETGRGDIRSMVDLLCLWTGHEGQITRRS